MQRIKTVRYPMRNIGGDRCMQKLLYIQPLTLTIPNGQSAVVSAPIQFNGGVSLGVLLGSTPGLAALAQQFLFYKISGIKLSVQCWPQTSAFPLLLFIEAAANGSTFIPTPIMATVCEQRWCVYKVLNNPLAGARPTTVKAYYSVNKVHGPDATVKGDLDFTGALQTTAPYWNSNPNEGPSLRIGACTMNGGPIGNLVDGNIYTKISAVLYVKFFGRRPTQA